MHIVDLRYCLLAVNYREGWLLFHVKSVPATLSVWCRAFSNRVYRVRFHDLMKLWPMFPSLCLWFYTVLKFWRFDGDLKFWLHVRHFLLFVELCSVLQVKHFLLLIVKVKVTLRLTISWPVCLDVRRIWDPWPIFLSPWELCDIYSFWREPKATSSHTVQA
jgi:hypothetical protein